MEIAYHVGVHCTDNDLLLRSMVKNRNRFGNQGVIVPGPGQYREAVREGVAAFMTRDVPAIKSQALLEKVTDGADVDRVVMSNANFCALPSRVFAKGELYRLLPTRIETLTRLFPGHEIEIFMAIRNPATFIPAVFATAENITYDAFMGGLYPDEVSWVDLILDIRDAAPQAKLTVWCNEDTPFLWPRLIRALAGIAAEKPIKGGYDLLADILTDEGIQRLAAYIAQRKPKSEEQRQKIIAAFMDRFGRDDAMEVQPNLPGWSDTLISDMTDLYDEDLDQIADIEGVTLLEP